MGRVLGGEPDVRAQGELTAAAQCVAGDRGDDRLGDAGHGGERRLERPGPEDHVHVGHVGHLLDVRTGGEHPLTAVQHHGADVVALGRLDGGGPDLLLHRDVQRIHLRPVQADGADPVGHLEAYELAHARLRPTQCSGLVSSTAP
jgi:hypothetical protein